MDGGTKTILLSDRVLRWLAWLLVGIYFLLAGAGILLLLLADPPAVLYGIPMIVWVLLLVVVGVWPVIGALIINRHPRHPVGWLLFATFPVIAVVLFAIGYASYATSPTISPLPIPRAVSIWLTGIAQPFALVAITWMNLLFPTGRLLSPRWRIAGWGAVVALPIVLVLQILWPGSLSLFPELHNPFGVAESYLVVLAPIYLISYTILLLCSLASVLSLFLRLRKSHGEERQQVKWLVLPAFVFWLGQPSAPFVTYYGLSGFVALADSLSVILTTISVPLIVIAVAVAIFRYRLYDIDVIIRRTLVYGALTATLAVVYFSSIVLLQGLFVAISGQQSAIAVVISTLFIAALFTPLRRRIQNDIDRRFYRRKYDAEKVVSAFSAGLREQVDIEQLSERLLVVVEETLQPESLSLWLKK